MSRRYEMLETWTRVAISVSEAEKYEESEAKLKGDRCISDRLLRES
jgi:hypothetical protein